ncbi:TRI25 ligase, partial [Polypterus senegalus]
MAEAQLFVSQDEFTCSVCLDTLTDPVAIPCGQSFCLKCLMDCWDQSQLFSCPKCRENFTTRFTLRRNSLLNEILKKFKKTGLSSPPSQNYAGPGDVECDFCTGKKLRAVKSCLTCPASYCQNHLQPHFEIAAWKDHKLVNPDRNLKEKLCEKHQKSLEIFCETDDACICMMCGVTEHNSHKMVKLEMEREEKEKQLGATLSDIMRKLEEREKTLKEMRRMMEELKISVERDMEENDNSFTALIQCTEEVNRKLTERIREQEKREMEKAEGVMEQLEKEIEELKRREAELKELSETKDHLHFLQSFSSHCVLPADGDSLSFTVTTGFTAEEQRKELSDLTKSLENISQWVIMTRTPSGKCECLVTLSLLMNYAGPGDVECDFCTGKKLRAVKSCLTCPASYCQNHLQPHYEVAAWKDHKLVNPDRNLKEKLCEKHQKSLEIFCETDDTCICMMCGVNEHNGHEMVKLETGREKKEKQTLSDIKRRLEEREKTLKEMRRVMEEIKISVERDMEENEKSFTALIRCTEEVNRKLTERIREQEKRQMEKAEGVMEQLEKEIEELKRREAELKELSETKDHLHFLQTFSSRCVLPADGDSLSFTAEDLRKELSGLIKTLENISRWVIMTWTPSDFCPLTLDINTANRQLHLSEGNKKVTWEGTWTRYPDHPDRFECCYQVLCREALTGTRCYWEVEGSGRFMRIGVAYKGLGRKGWGRECGLGNNDKSWAPQAFGCPLVVTTGPYRFELLSCVPVVPKATRAVAPMWSGGSVSPPLVLVGILAWYHPKPLTTVAKMS